MYQETGRQENSCGRVIVTVDHEDVRSSNLNQIPLEASEENFPFKFCILLFYYKVNFSITV